VSAARVVNLAEARHRRHFARLAAQLLSLGVMPAEVRSWPEPEFAEAADVMEALLGRPRVPANAGRQPGKSRCGAKRRGLVHGGPHDHVGLHEIRGGLDYADQVPRWKAFEAAHPDVEITYNGPFWQAVLQQDVGETLITRYELGALLDKLEQMEGRRGAPKPP
jgi:hypothetical protein